MENSVISKIRHNQIVLMEMIFPTRIHIQLNDDRYSIQLIHSDDHTESTVNHKPMKSQLNVY